MTMIKNEITRQDAWSERDDELLLNTVLRHIREGSTQMNAFEEVGDLLDRTAPACGFRWNAVVRKEHEHLIKDAKRERKQRQRVLKGTKKLLYTPPLIEQLSPINQNEAIAQAISLLQGTLLEKTKHASVSLEEQTALKEEIEKWKEKYEALEKEHTNLLMTLNRARKMVLFNGEEEKKAAFKMEKNGNLERVIQ